MTSPPTEAAYLAGRGRFPGRTRKYLSTNPPRRPWSCPPQLRHVIRRSGAAGDRTLTILYAAPQLGQLNSMVSSTTMPGNLELYGSSQSEAAKTGAQEDTEGSVKAAPSGFTGRQLT